MALVRSVWLHLLKKVINFVVNTVKLSRGVLDAQLS